MGQARLLWTVVLARQFLWALSWTNLCNSLQRGTTTYVVIKRFPDVWKVRKLRRGLDGCNGNRRLLTGRTALADVGAVL